MATIIPIIKKGNKFITLPVSLKLGVCKFFEFIIQERMLHYFNIFCQIMILCRMNLFLKPCMAQLLYELNVWTKSLDRRDFVDALHLDVMKAFDSVSQCKITKNHSYVKGTCIRSKKFVELVF